MKLKNNIHNLNRSTTMNNSNRKPRGYWTLEKCKEETLKFNSRTEWQNKSKGSYDAAFNNNWIDECTTHMSSTHVRPRSINKLYKKEDYLVW